MRNIKNKIKKIIPDEILHLYLLKRYRKREGKTYKYFEKKISNEYNYIYNKQINWENPKTYTEKLNVAKLYCNTKEKTELTDKLLVREWIGKKIGENYLIPLLGVYDNFKDIDFDILPNEFVIKCNHDSGSVTVVKDKNKINKKKLEKKYNFYLKRNFSMVGYELHYGDIKPKIIIEKYLGESINDYKFLCFDSKVHYCWVDFDRFGNHKRNIYDLDWNLQPFNQYSYGNYEKNVEKPIKLNEMIEIAKKLCYGFPHVRVDLYLINEKIYFGEMTFTNGSGFEKISPDSYDIMLGDLWNIDNEELKRKRKNNLNRKFKENNSEV